MRRAAYLEDPAQLDPVKRADGIDGLRANEQPHRCAVSATRIADPDAFATAFARGIDHPNVRDALDRPFDPKRNPREVTVPIADLLGPDGYKHCTGWQLEAVGGSMSTARTNRAAWRAARAEDRQSDVPEPRTRPVPTFEDGVMTFAFKGNHVDKRYEVSTMYPQPRETGA
jgi:hypothetical protein